MPEFLSSDHGTASFDYSGAVVVTPARNAFQRLLNRIGRPYGIAPFPVAFDSVLPKAGDRTAVFAEISDKNVWGSAESLSGPGSEIARTEHYRHQLISLLKRRAFRSVFDAPCGDLNWMTLVLDEVPIEYRGGDISQRALSVARQRRPGVEVIEFDICADLFPQVQLWHCRDSLFHLSFADIWAALRNVAKSKVDFALITTHRSRLLKNLDIRTGGFRLLDLERAPFFLPPPLEYLSDTATDSFPRSVGLWPMSAIVLAVEHAAR